MHERFENSERGRISKQRIAEEILLGSRCRYKKPGGQYKHDQRYGYGNSEKNMELGKVAK